MQVIKNDATLQAAITELIRERDAQLLDLKQDWEIAKTELNPLTLLKNGAINAVTSPDLIKGLLSLAAGFVTRKLIVGGNGGAVRKIVGTVAQTGATSLAYKGGDMLKKKAAPFLSTFLKKLKIGE